MTAVQAIIFDFGGTLDLSADHWLDRFLRHYRANGIEIERHELDPAFAYATGQGYHYGPGIAEVSLRRLIELLVNWQIERLASDGPSRVRAALVDCATAADVKERVIEGFYRQTAAGMECSRPLIDALARRFRLAVVSNFYGNLDRVLAEAGLSHNLAALVDSTRINIYKPDPRIFQVALAKLGCRPENVVMVGDSPSKDCAPARALGMRTVWLGKRLRASSRCDFADETISNLDELLTLGWCRDVGRDFSRRAG